MITSEKYRKLFEPATIGTMRLKNRLVMAPMGVLGLMENDGLLGLRALDYYEERARGGVGLIITSAAFVSSKFDPLWTDGRYFPLPRMDTPAAAYRFNQLAERVHNYDCKLCVQLTAGLGRVSRPLYTRGTQFVSASANRAYWNPSITTRPLAIEEIEEIMSGFGTAAAMCRRAGVDAVELHCHEGYLFDQFMTALWNKRNDKYGGVTQMERMTFPLEALQSIKQATDGAMPVIFRFSMTHKMPGGRTVEEGREICRIVEDAGVAALDIDAGCYERWYWAHPPTYQPPACILDMAEEAKRTVKNIPVICVGKMYYPDVAVRAIEEGKADFVAIGRGLLADSEWPNKTKKGKTAEIRPCIGCHEGCLAQNRRFSLSCAVNPACGNEQSLRLTPAEVKKRVVVVGGGPGGMEAARVCKLRGHDVVLYEKAGELGGQVIAASVPDFKSDLRLLLDYYRNEMRRLGVTIHLNTEVTVEKLITAKPDVVFIATGAVAKIPDLSGVNKPRVASAIDVLLGKAAIGQRVVIVGGNSVACETAVYLARQGKQITIVKRMRPLLRDMVHVHANREMLINMLEECNVTISANIAVDEVTKDGLRVLDKDMVKREISADTVIFATGLVSCDNLSEALREKVEEVYRIGDCVAPGNIIDAVWQAFGKARLV